MAKTETHAVLTDLAEYLRFLDEIGAGGLNVQMSAGATAPSISREPPESRPAAGRPSDASRVPLPSDGSAAKIPDLRPTSPTPEPLRPEVSRLSQLPSLKARKPTNFFDKYNPREEETERKSGEAREPKSIEIIGERADVTETVGEIQMEIGPACTRCKLCELGRTQVVNSVGNHKADLMFCGEAPGADEDRLGEPFVGRAGQLLTDIIEKGLEIPRKDVFIGNINRCRPPGNRAPEEDESSVCKPFLLREIAVVRPRVIVTLGATATQNLLQTKVPIGKLRGKFHDLMGAKVMPTFHPAYLLRDPNKKRDVWDDMKLVKEFLRTK